MFGWQSRGSQTFSKSFRCYSMSNAPKKVPDHVKYGGKIFLPVSALEILASLNIVYPMLFELKNPDEEASTFCGVMEFIAEEGRVYVPDWMMPQLKIQEGEILQVKSTSVPLGRFIKIQPQHENFLEITNPKAVLETALRNFACLTVGDMIEIKYNEKIYRLKVLEAKPSESICIIEADVEVDFAPPPGYVDPSTKKQQQEQKQLPDAMEEDLAEATGFIPFSGGGQKLNGRQTPQSGPTPSSSSTNLAKSPSSPTPFGSVGRSSSPYGSIGRSPSPRQPSPFGTPNFSKNAAPMAVPAGKLVFGKVSTPSGTSAPSSSSLTSSLNANANRGSPTGDGFVAFSGSGNSLK